MIALDELKKLPIEERYRIVEELERSIDEERGSYQETPEFIAEIMRRDEYLRANPSSGSTWEEVETRIRAKHA